MSSDEILKIILGVTLFIVTFVPSCITYFLSRRQRWPVSTSAFLCFGAGVLFQTSYIHLYGEAQDSIPNAASIIFCISFFSLYALDEIFHFCFSDHGLNLNIKQSLLRYFYRLFPCLNPELNAHLRPLYDQTSFDAESINSTESRGSCSSERSSMVSTIEEGRNENRREYQAVLSSSPKVYGSMGETERHNVSAQDEIGAIALASPSPVHARTPSFHKGRESRTTMSTSRSSHSLPDSPRLENKPPRVRKTSLLERNVVQTHGNNNISSPSTSKSHTMFRVNSTLENEQLLEKRRLSWHMARQQREEYNEIADTNVMCHVNLYTPCTASSSLGHWGLFVGLCFHSFWEGTPIGAETEAENLIFLTGAIASHKLVIALCFGLELMGNETGRLNFLLQAFIFASMTPVGIGLSHILSSAADSYAVPIMQAVAGGSLLYVALCEILPRERSKWHHHQTKIAAGIIQLLSFGVGFSIMYCIDIFLVPGLPGPPCFVCP